VYRENTFTSAIIEVAENQKVISTGPYAFVRHPMYASASLYLLGTPLALGSCSGFVSVAAMIPFLIWRLIDEERFLAGHLSGYTEYQKRVCAVKRWRFPVGVSPTRQMLQPEATGAIVEVTKRLKPSVMRVTNWWQRECAGRNASERRANLEKVDAQADPTTLSGKADTAG
jgi:hypothetical protein